MLHQIVSLALSAATAILTALPVDVAHHHCDAPENPLCVPKGAVPHDDGGLSGCGVALVFDSDGRPRANGGLSLGCRAIIITSG